jgi:hypothetical protein
VGAAFADSNFSAAVIGCAETVMTTNGTVSSDLIDGKRDLKS